MPEKTTWKQLTAQIHRMGGWYADQRVVDDLRPHIERYAATLGYSSPEGPTSSFTSVREVTRDDITDALLAELTDEILAAYRGEADRLMQQLALAERARDDFQAESRNKDLRLRALEDTRQTWMNQAQKLDADRTALIEKNMKSTGRVDELSRELRVALDKLTEAKTELAKVVKWREQDLKALGEWQIEAAHRGDEIQRLKREGTHVCTEECVTTKIPTWDGTEQRVEVGAVLNQVQAAVERAEAAAEEAAERAAEAILKALRAAEPGSYRIGSEGGVWLRVGALEKEPEGWAAVTPENRPLLAGADESPAERLAKHDVTPESDTPAWWAEWGHRPEGADVSDLIMVNAPAEWLAESITELEDAPMDSPELRTPVAGRPYMPSADRKCTRCGETYPLATGWVKDANKTGGYRSPCKACINKRRDQTKQGSGRIREAASTALTPETPRTTPAAQLTLELKTCNECKITKGVEKFSKDAKSSGGVKGKCKDCCARRDALRNRKVSR